MIGAFPDGSILIENAKGENVGRMHFNLSVKADTSKQRFEKILQ